MENLGIWDIISKLVEKTPQNKNENEKQVFSSPQTLTQNEEGEQKSYLKSYNPFATPLAKPHQITSPRTQKPAKTSIDLTASKNVAKEQKNKSTGDMIGLINRHNRFSREIQNKNKP